MLLVLLIPYSIPAQLTAQHASNRPVEGLQRNVPRDYLLTGARVVVSPTQTLPQTDVMIKAGRIVQVGPQLQLEPGMQQIDCAEKSLYAGLFDAYSEFKFDAASDVNSDWNRNVHPEVQAADYYQPDAALNESYRKSGIVARLVAPTGGQIKGTSAIVSTGSGNSGEVMLSADAGLHVSLTVAGFGRGDGYPGSPMGALTLVRQTLYDVDWYDAACRAADASALVSRPEKNESLSTLKRLRDQQIPLLIDASNELYFMRADAIAREFSWRAIIRGSGREYRRLQDIADTGRSVIVPVLFPKAPDVSTPEAARTATLERLMHWDIAPENPRMLAEAGVTIAFTTAGLDRPGEFLPAVRTAVRRGLSSAAALHALTVAPTKMFGLEHRLGTIEAGKLASLILVKGDLFDKDARILETWVEGERFELDPPDQDVQGTWTMHVASEPPLTVALNVKRKGKRWRGTATIDENRIKGSQVNWQSGRFSADVPTSNSDHPGVSRMTVFVDSDQLAGQTFVGHWFWPDGTQSKLSATWTEDQSGEADGPDQPDQPDQPDKSDKSETDEPDKSHESDESDAELPTDPLFAANYPLGDYGLEHEPERPSVVAFRGATVWTSGPAGVLPQATVLVQAGKIVAVGSDVSVPEDALIIDASGKHITPGIIDCHSHIATDSGLNEATQAVTAEVRISDFIDPNDISIYRQIAGGTTCANILHGSANPIGGQNQVIKLRWGANAEDLKFKHAPPGIKFALGENVKQSNWGDDHRSRYPQTRMGVDEIINDAFQRARVYQRRRLAWTADPRGLPPRRDLELDALAEVLDGKRWIHCHSYRQSEILALMKTCDRYGVTIGTFQHILEGYKLADEMAKRGIMASAFADWWAYKFEVYDAIPYAAAIMHQAGVVVSLNSDDAELGRHLNIDAAKAVKYGNVPAPEALQFVTLNPARQLRIDKYVGSLEAGKDADLVVWSTSPLSIYAICEQTWIDGRPYFSREAEQQLRQRDAQRRAALEQRILANKASQLRADEDDKTADTLWPREDIFCHGHHHDQEIIHEQ